MQLAASNDTGGIVEIEWSLIGAVIAEPARMADAAAVEPRMFTDEVARNTWHAMLDLQDEGEPLDLVLIADRLTERKQVANMTQIVEVLDASFGAPANTAAYAKLIRDRAFDRWIAAATRAVASAAPGNVQDALAKLSRLITMRADQQLRFTMPEALQAWHDEQEAERNGTALRIPTGLPALDRWVGRLRAGRLYVVAARPGMGKTAFALNIAAAAARERFVVCFVSLEMLAEDLAARMISIESGASQDVVSGRQEPDLALGDLEAIANAKRAIAGWPITVRLCPESKTNRVIQCAREEITKGAQLVIVDYLQKMQGDPKAARHEQIGDAIQALKNLAISARVPVVVLCQLNRELEKREDKRPRLSDLRDSGWIEQEADVVLGIYRPHVYDDDADPGECEIGVLKQRFGKLGACLARFETWSQRFAPSARGVKS